MPTYSTPDYPNPLESKPSPSHLSPLQEFEQEQVVYVLVAFFLPHFKLSGEHFFDDDDMIPESSNNPCPDSIADDPCVNTSSEE